MAAELLLRRRLLNAITSSPDNVIYVHAPSGFGKTVLATQWSEMSSEPTIWFDAFATTRDTHLFRSMINTVVSAIPSLKKHLERFGDIQELDEKALADLIEVLESSRLSFNLVVDKADYLRTSYSEFARQLICKMPRNIRLLLLTSNPPRTSFLQECGPGRFTFISPSDLRFSIEETEKYSEQLNISIPRKRLIELHELTQGWPIGIHIALTQLQVHGDFDELLSSIRGEGDEKFSAAALRILAHLKGEELEILTRLSLLESIDSEATITLSRNPNSVKILTVLSQDSMVLTQRGSAPPKFTIHPMLRKTLINEFIRSDDFAERTEDIIQFLKDRRQYEELIRILLELGATQQLRSVQKDEKMLKIIEDSIDDAIDQSSIERLKNWIKFSSYLAEDGVMTFILNFYFHFLSDRASEANAHLRDFRNLVLDGHNGAKSQDRVILHSLQAILDFKLGRLDKCFDNATTAINLANESQTQLSNHELRALHLALLGQVIKDDDFRVKEIAQVLQHISFDSFKLSGDPRIYGMNALIAAQQGRFTESQNELDVAFIPNVVRSSGFFAAFDLNIVEAMIQSEAGNHPQVCKTLEDASSIALMAGNLPIAISTLGRAAYQRILNGDANTALAYISKARDLISIHGLSEEMHTVVDLWEVRVRYWLVDHRRVTEIIARSKNSYLMKAFEAGILINSNSPQSALEIIDSFDLEIPRQKLTYHLFRAHILSESPSAQLEEVKAAVEIGSRNGYFNHFLTQRSDVIQQYISLVAQVPNLYNERLARAAGARLNEMMVGNTGAGTPLTRREADILRHLATSLSIVEIAQTLCISRNTMKTHCKNIYRKLGAQDRKDAVSKGKQLLKV